MEWQQYVSVVVDTFYFTFSTYFLYKKSEEDNVR